MRSVIIGLLVMGSAVTALAQLRVTSVEVLPLDGTRQWSAPRFSPDGTRLYVTSPDYRGIWEYEFARNTVRQLTDEPGAGYGFALSADGTLLAYRRTIGDDVRTRRQELVLRRLDEPAGEVVAADRKLPLPAFSENRIVYREMPAAERPATPSPDVTLLGIDDTRIALLVDGSRRLVDPLGTGRYIWPALSPDRTRIAAVQMERGALVCDLEGTLLALLGRCNAPSWTWDGRWIVGMDDRDDGHQITGSDLIVVAPDGTRAGRLTATDDVAEMFPACSPVDNRIAYATLEGQIHVLRYGEEER